MNRYANGPDTDADCDERWWIVHFAPSSAKHVLPILGKHFDMPGTTMTTATATPDPGGQTSDAMRRARLAAIGPTTSTYLESELHLRVDVVATKPNPNALVEGITSWDENQRG